MLTRNFMHMLGNTSGMGVDNLPKPIETSGQESTTALNFGVNGTDWPFHTNKFSNYSKLILGTGTTPSKSTDYNLESEITESYDCAALSKRYIQGETKDHINVYGVITNTGDATITVNEVGWIVKSFSSTFLMARQVLDKPVTIEPGEAKTFNVRL